MRLINYPKVKTCPAGQKLIKWSAQGPAGPAGPVGPKGDPGAKGDQGPAGASGSSDWGDIASKPADFADNVDDVGTPGYYSYTQPTEYSVSVGDPCKWFSTQSSPANVDTEVMFIPTDLMSTLEIERELIGTSSDGKVYRSYCVKADPGSYGGIVHFKVRVRVFDQGIAPAALKRIAKGITVHVGKKPGR